MRVLALLIACFLSCCPAAAQSCRDIPGLAKQFIAVAGTVRIREQAWFKECVLPEARDAPAWASLEAYAYDVNRYGRQVTSFSHTGNTLRVDVESASLAVRLYVDRDGKIADIESPQVTMTGKSPQQVADQLAGLPGKLSVTVEEDGKLIASIAPDEPLQISSTMKLGILKALLDEVDAGRLKLQSNALVRPDLKALPSGTLHQFPDYAPVTIHSLATLMMRDSDNTAADILIDAIGRDKVAAALGLPYLMTYHQWFMLKSDDSAYAQFVNLDKAGRKAYLDSMTPAIPLNYSDSIGGLTPEAGWHVPTRRICAIASSVAASTFAQLESTLVLYDEWQSVASKAGGDQTSRSDTLVLTRLDGRRFCVSATWNTVDSISDDSRYISLVTSLIEAVRRY